jgi:hypothetical protein
MVSLRRECADIDALRRMQLTITTLSILTAMYLLCFRLDDLDTAASVKTREDGTVEELGRDASSISKTSGGEQL